MKHLVTVCMFAVLVLSNFSCAQDQSFYDLKSTTITGEEFLFSSLKGKKVMIVNTASECGFTPQYEQLEALYQMYKDSNFVIIGFPANNFGSQEPGTNDEIASFCKKNFGVTFLMMSKISVKGDDQDPVYAYLTQKVHNGQLDSDVKWNFQKYLIDENGVLQLMFGSRTVPNDKSILEWLAK